MVMQNVDGSEYFAAPPLDDLELGPLDLIQMAYLNLEITV